MPALFPEAREDDPEDVSWALTTGLALFKRGERDDAIVWLRRAVEAAVDGGRMARVEELRDAVQALTAPRERIESIAEEFVQIDPEGAEAEELTERDISRDEPEGATALLDPRTNPSWPPEPELSELAVPSRSGFAQRTEDTATPGVGSVAEVPAHTDDELDALLDGTLEETVPGVTAAAFAEEHSVDLAAIADYLEAPPEDLVSVQAVRAAPDTNTAVAPAAHELPEPEPEPARVSVEGVAALGGLSPEQRERLGRLATIEELGPEEEVPAEGLVVLISGWATVQAPVSDVEAVRLEVNDFVYGRCSIADAQLLRVVAGADGARVAVWASAEVDQVFADSPGLSEHLRQLCDWVQAAAGCTVGPLGERLDAQLRGMLLSRLEVRVLPPGDLIAASGQPVPGMVIVGAGGLELEQDGNRVGKLGPGDFLFAGEVLAGGAAPADARATAKGAILLFGERQTAQELLVTCPPLLEVFAGM